MQVSHNTVLITGGGSGIGRALAETFHAVGNQVIIAGRRQDLLDEVVAANPGMAAATLDIESAHDIKQFAARLLVDFPALNVVIHNAGIMRSEKLLDGQSDDAAATVAINLMGPIYLNAALLPHLAALADATIMTVSSGLAFMPLALNPTYCASKAAIHSYTQSLRYQLKATHVKVLELVPPYVQTGLTGQRQAEDPHAMPLKGFIAEVMSILQQQPEATEICVERVKAQRYAAASEKYDEIFKTFNDAMTAARAGE